MKLYGQDLIDANIESALTEKSDKDRKSFLLLSIAQSLSNINAFLMKQYVKTGNE